MITKVGIKGAEFYAYHGYYEAEQLSGNTFVVDAEVSIDSFDSIDDNISDTVNYESLYNIIKYVMSVKQQLLESVVLDIVTKIRSDFSNVKSGKVRLEKVSPQLGGKVGKSYVEMEF
jgi:dihydroneopterin aldolase